MKCPLFLAGGLAKHGEVETKHFDCLKEKCAWWDLYSDQCAIWAIARALNLYGKPLEELVNKMPHAGQFLK